MSQDALDLLLSGVKDQGQRKQITSAYYAFANGDPETFAVQFAVLLRAHASSSEIAAGPAGENARLGDAQTERSRHCAPKYRGRIASLLDQPSRRDWVGERLDTTAAIQPPLEEWFAAHAELFRSEREKIVSAVAANALLTQRLAAHRILLTVILSYIGGLLTTLLFHELLAFCGLMLSLN